MVEVATPLELHRGALSVIGNLKGRISALCVRDDAAQLGPCEGLVISVRAISVHAWEYQPMQTVGGQEMGSGTPIHACTN